MKNKNKLIAVIGGGISGLSAAWHISKNMNVVLFEESNRLGGHANTIEIKKNQTKVPLDIGFMVYNETNYPNLTNFFKILRVSTSDANMSFTFSDYEKNYEYSGSGLKGYFGQYKNIFNPQHLQLFNNIRKFYSKAEKVIPKYAPETSLGKFLESEGFPHYFVDNHILPMSAAIWSNGPKNMLDYPVHDFVSFFSNHGLLKYSNRPQWKSIKGGSQEYIKKIIKTSSFRTITNSQVIRIEKSNKGYNLITSKNDSYYFDILIFACPADKAKKIIGETDLELSSILEKFKYQKNTAILHNDIRQMPINRKLWSSWNYIRKNKSMENNLSVTYWLNNIQHVQSKENFFLTLNPCDYIDNQHIYKSTSFYHPIFNTNNKNLKSKIINRQGNKNIWVCGSYLGYGFHEDGIQSGLNVAEAINKNKRPWTVNVSWNRIAIK